jgi:hypothetical protein
MANLVTVVRVIEYNGTKEWIEGVINASRIPLTGKVTISPQDGKTPFPPGCFIRSGMVEWGAVEQPEARPVIPIPPSSPV